MSSTRSKGEANLTDFTDDREKIGRNKARRRSKRMADTGNTDPQHQEEDHHEPQDGETGDMETVIPTVEMYLPDLDNTPLSQALKNRLDWGMEDEVMVECPKLKQYFGVDTLLVQRISGRVCLHTNDEVETFPINCSRTKFSPFLLQKALERAEKQRATSKDLQEEDWPWKLKTILGRMELDKRLDAYAELVGRYTRNSVSLEHAHIVNRGSADGYLEVAKYELQGRKISNRMDEILAVIMQDNAYSEQAKFNTYPRPSINPINQLITSPAEAAQREADNIMAIAFPSGSKPPLATSDPATTQTIYSAPPTAPLPVTAVTIAVDRLSHGKPQQPASPSFTMNTIMESHSGAPNPLLTVNRGNEGNGNSFITPTMVTTCLNCQNTIAFENQVPEADKQINACLAEIANQGLTETTVTNCLDHPDTDRCQFTSHNKPHQYQSMYTNQNRSYINTYNRNYNRTWESHTDRTFNSYGTKGHITKHCTKQTLWCQWCHTATHNTAACRSKPRSSTPMESPSAGS